MGRGYSVLETAWFGERCLDLTSVLHPHLLVCGEPSGLAAPGRWAHVASLGSFSLSRGIPGSS